MRPQQTTLSVPLDVRPESCSRLSALLEKLREDEDAGASGHLENFSRIRELVPTLHFMSLSVFTSENYDPIFILEANFDGPPGVFWGQLEAALGPRLREMLRCCKQPLDDDRPLYDAVTAPDARTPVAPYLEARTQRPSVYHHGNRGMGRDRILEEKALFLSVRKQLDEAEFDGIDPYRGMAPADVHRRLRERMLPAHAWLDAPAPARFPFQERISDIARLLLFVVATLFVLSLPGFLLAIVLPTFAYLVVVAVLAAPVVMGLLRMRKALPGTAVPSRFSAIGFLARHAPLILGYVVIAAVLLVPLVVLGSYLLALVDYREALTLKEAFWEVARALFLSLFSLAVVIPLILLWLRYLERRDASHDAPPVDERLFREMLRREDWVAQNHMGSIVLIKPGVLRMIIIRAGHLGLGLLLRVIARDGYLGSMRTVHFAHWAFLNNGSRLLFFSNFDHSWASYLDDFIEKAHVGLTLAWGCGVGFPPTRFLIYDGASHGRRFKNWALASRAVSRFWYSAYPELTVDQIERNYRIASGLRRRSLNDKEARQWMRDL